MSALQRNARPVPLNPLPKPASEKLSITSSGITVPKGKSRMKELWDRANAVTGLISTTKTGVEDKRQTRLELQHELNSIKKLMDEIKVERDQKEAEVVALTKQLEQLQLDLEAEKNKAKETEDELKRTAEERENELKLTAEEREIELKRTAEETESELKRTAEEREDELRREAEERENKLRREAEEKEKELKSQFEAEKEKMKDDLQPLITQVYAILGKGEAILNEL